MGRITPETVFDEKGQLTDWQNRVARELNILLGRAQYLYEAGDDETDQEVAAATLSIVERVANFENIEIE